MLPPVDDRRAGGGGASAWLRMGSVALAMIVLQLGGPAVRGALRYERTAILAGQWWRLLTGHFVHLSWAHCLLNVAGLVLCLILAPRLFRGPFLWVRLAVLALAIGLLLLAFDPWLQSYVGLSGVVYGLLVAGLLPQARHDWIVRACLLFILGWMGWQLLAGPALSEEQLIGGRIVGQAHLYGVLAAVGMLLAESAWRKNKGRFAAQ